MKPQSEIETTKSYPITVAVKYWQPSGLADDPYTPEFLVYAKDIETAITALAKISDCGDVIVENRSMTFRLAGTNSYAVFITPNTDAYLASSFLAAALEHMDPDGMKLLLRILREFTD